VAGAPDDPFDDPSNWRASLVDGGSPGTDGNFVAPSADFDGDGLVSGRDFLIWQRNVGGSGGSLATGDSDLDGNVDATDLGVWQEQYGSAGAPATAHAVLSYSTAVESAAVAISADATYEPDEVSEFWLSAPDPFEHLDSNWYSSDVEHSARRQARLLQNYDEAFASFACAPWDRPHQDGNGALARRAADSSTYDERTKQVDQEISGTLIHTRLTMGVVERV
jgi:hypothetical protein